MSPASDRRHSDGGLAALALAVAAFSLFAIGDAGSKLVVVESNAVIAMWGRSVAFALFLLVMIRPAQLKPALLRAPAKLLLLRSLFPYLGGLCVIVAMAHVPLAQVTTILFVAPLISMALGQVILGEPVNRWGWLAVALGFLGVLTIMRPFGGAFSWALLIPAIGGIFAALGQVMTRVVAQRTTPRSVLLYMVLVALTLSSLPLPFFWQAPTGQQWLLLALSGFCQAAGQFCMIAAYARATASRIAPYSYAQLLTATVLGFALFGELPDIFTVAGAALIVAGGLISLHLAGRPAPAAPAKAAAAETAP
ncbi:DMT family transporter [Bosea sp. (in: a-proteobacteria)]|uniref:DMT family transporter n=1 Tax=Bosea sp. (in: a-proteobacteria) TaxID=1871050 RepID=UPI003F723609